jgi:formylglycine-generating enzyme required for sulfatase activity
MMGSAEEEIAELLRMGEENGFSKAWLGKVRSEAPQHRVRITKPFYLAAHEITVAQFETFVDAMGHKTEAETDGKGGLGYVDGEPRQSPEFTWRSPGFEGFEQSDRHPVVHIGWNDAMAFCRWLTKKEGETYKLPTEAQWEYACRSGSTTSWFFGQNEADLEQHAWFASRGSGWTKQVGQKQPNDFGLFDMSGNVREWRSDWFSTDYYGRSPADDPKGPPIGTHRVLRGGAYFFRPVDVRSACRDEVWKTPRTFINGFRPVLPIGTDLPKPTPEEEPRSDPDGV